jgi:hypothetical protein
VVSYEKKGGLESVYYLGDDVHSLTIGATRSGKSRCIVLQSIAYTALVGESMLVNNPKGELAATITDNCHCWIYLKNANVETATQAALVSGVLAFVIHALAGGTILPVLTVLVTAAASVMALAKGENNMSVIDHTKCVLRFAREQRKYPYYYTDEWGDWN